MVAGGRRIVNRLEGAPGPGYIEARISNVQPNGVMEV